MRAAGMHGRTMMPAVLGSDRLRVVEPAHGKSCRGAAFQPHIGIDVAVSDWTIRHANDRDLERVLALWDAAGSTETVTDTREGLLGLLAADPQALLLAESDDGSVVGSLIAAWDGWRGSFYRLAVHPAWRRAGLASALLREGESRLLACGAARLTAIVADDGPGAIGFWTAAGYERQASRARFVRNFDQSRLGP